MKKEPIIIKGPIVIEAGKPIPKELNDAIGMVADFKKKPKQKQPVVEETKTKVEPEPKAKVKVKAKSKVRRVKKK